MKRLSKIIGALAVLVVLCVVGFVIVIQALRARSDREVRQIVAELAPGMSFSAVTNRLGQPAQTFTSEEEILVFGTSRNVSIVSNSILYAFSHLGPPYRWIIVYTDKQSQKVLYADIKNL